MHLPASTLTARLQCHDGCARASATPDVSYAHGQSATGKALHAIVERYIQSVSVTCWPAALRQQGDRAIDAACQYGLGLIRLLAEYQMLEGTAEFDCVELAVRLTTACSQTRMALDGADPTPEPRRRTGEARHPRFPWRASSSRPGRGKSHPAESADAVRVSPEAATAPPRMWASAGTPDAHGSDGTPATSCR